MAGHPVRPRRKRQSTQRGRVRVPSRGRPWRPCPLPIWRFKLTKYASEFVKHGVVLGFLAVPDHGLKGTNSGELHIRIDTVKALAGLRFAEYTGVA